MSFYTLLLLLIAFQVKHFLIDFVFQTDRMVKEKGIYGKYYGLLHSWQHAIATAVICIAILPELYVQALTFVVVLEAFWHYHTDYFKMQYGQKHQLTPANRKYWIAIGLDQLSHQLNYLVILWILIKT